MAKIAPGVYCVGSMIRSFAFSTLVAAPLFAAAPYPSSQARVDLPALDTALKYTWNGIKARNIDAYGTGLIHRPKSEMPGDAVSEGSSYGMFLALYENDQTTFNRIWDATEKSMWSEVGQLYNWRVGPDLKLQGTGMATDADQDIALLLLFADSLVKKQVWRPYSTTSTKVDYKTRALALIKTLWNSAVEDGRYLAPGAGWGGKNFVNPGYFSPASYRIFAQADPSHDWNGVIDQSYATIFANPGASKGLLPDWMVPDGGFYTGSLGYNPFHSGQAMYKDAIRIHWRLAMDWLWFGEPRAKRFLDSALAFVGNPANANFYRMDGSLVPVESTFTLMGGEGPTRSRREHSALTVGMWACAAMASKDPAVRQAWAEKLLSFLDSPKADYWGHAVDPLGGAEDTLHNEVYFDQFLAWFGAATLAGRFSNVWADLADPSPGVKLSWVQAPSLSSDDLDFDQGNLVVRGRLSKPAAWSVIVKDSNNVTVWSANGNTDSVVAVWNGQTTSGKAFPQGWFWVDVHAGNLDNFAFRGWVGHQRDIRSSDKQWLIVDEFAASSLSPNLGAWKTFNNSDKGGSAKVTNFGVTSGALGFDYDLGENGYQFCGAAWEPSGWSGFTGVKTITYRMRARARTVVDFYLVQSDIGDDNYWQAFDTVGTEWKTYTHDLSALKGRFGERSGSPDLSKTTAIRWHIQKDRPGTENSSLTGHLEIDDFRVGGDMAAMYEAPAPKMAKPNVSIESRARTSARMASTFDGIRIEASSAGTAVVRNLSGKVLATSLFQKGVTTIPCAHRGTLVVETRTLEGTTRNTITRF